MRAGRGEAEHYVSRLDRGAVERLVDDADARPGEVELSFPVDAGQLGGLAADERDAGASADLGRAVDELGHRLEIDVGGGDVVEQDQRLGTACDHVVDAMRGEIRAAGAQGPALPGEDQLRPDAVGRGGDESPVAERVERREGAEARRAGRLVRRAQPFDDGVGRERHAGVVVCACFPLAQQGHSKPAGRRPFRTRPEPGSGRVSSGHGACCQSRRSGAPCGRGLMSIGDLSGTWFQTCPK